MWPNAFHAAYIIVSTTKTKRQYENFRRKQPQNHGVENKVTFTDVMRDRMSATRNTLKKITHNQANSRFIQKLTLCQECTTRLRKPENVVYNNTQNKDKQGNWRNTWPSFFWDVLSCRQESDRVYFHKIYPPMHL